MMAPLTESEKLFLDYIKKGVFRVYKNGNIYKCKQFTFKGESRKINPRLVGTKSLKNVVRIVIRKNNKFYTILTSRLIYLHFNGGIPLGKEIEHRNDIKDDNRLINLRAVTHIENMNTYRNGKKIEEIKSKYLRGEKRWNAKLKSKDILKIRKMIKEGVRLVKIAKIFNVTGGTISNIKSGRIWSWL